MATITRPILAIIRWLLCLQILLRAIHSAKFIHLRLCYKFGTRRRKALLIGIKGPQIPPLTRTPQQPDSLNGDPGSDLQNDNQPLRGPHRDVENLRDLLHDVYCYNPRDITILIDDKNPEHVQPTRENIINAIKNLVLDAKPGDNFFFHFSGHCVQLDSEDNDRTEEDGKDEYMLTCDSKKVKDDELRQYLVDPLPAGSNLVAILDACHSATLLDLPHFRCNRVYVPWLNKGKRRTNTRQNRVVRDGARIPTPRRSPKITALLSSIEQILESPVSTTPFPSIAQCSSKECGPRDLPHINTRFFDGDSPFVTESPTSLFCDGWCRLPPACFMTLDRTPSADVMALSASKDEERSWEGPDGMSMTQALVKFLRNNPHPPLCHVLAEINHHLHGFYLDLHACARRYKAQVQAWNERNSPQVPKKGKSVEADNFQHPQLSSSRPLDMDAPWAP